MLGRQILRRLLQVVPVLLAVVTINFAIIHLAPGDPAVVMAGPAVSPEYVAAIHQEFGLDKPLPEQYLVYIANLLQGDLGQSITSRRPVIDLILERIGPTLLLMTTAWATSLALGLLLGTIAGMRRGSKLDRGLSVTTLTLYSIPVFWLALMLVSVLGLNLQVLPITGMSDVINRREGLAAVADVAIHMILPIVVMVAFYMPQFFQLTRASIEEVLAEDYVTTLRAAGLGKSGMFSRLVLKNASLPVFTLAGLWLGFSLTGAVLVEVIFAWPGLGRLLFDSALSRDYPVLLGAFAVASLMVVFIALVTDILYLYLDPRIRFSGQRD